MPGKPGIPQLAHMTLTLIQQFDRMQRRMTQLRFWRQYGREAWGFAIDVYRHFSEDRIPLAAGAISFFTLLSLFPLTLLALTLTAPYVQGVFLQDESIRAVLGDKLYTALQTQIFSAVNHQAFPSTLLTLLIGFWSGSQVFLILESAMNLAWQARKKRPFWLRRILAFIMIIIVAVLLAAAFFLVNLVRFLGRQEIPIWGHRVAELPWLVTTTLTIIIPLLLISALFAVIYRLLPSRQVTMRSVIPGALVSGILWLLALHLFGWYSTHFPASMVLYGSLSSMILLLFFFYYSAFILLLGAEISAANHRRLLRTGDNDEQRALLETEPSVPEQFLPES